MYDLLMARGGNQSKTDSVISSRSKLDQAAENVLYGETEAREQPAGSRQHQAMQELKAAYQELAPGAEALESAHEQLRQKIDDVEAAADAFASRWNDHGDKIGAFIDTIATNLSKDFFDFADHKPSCDRSPCSCGYEAAREYAAEVYRTATGEEAPTA